MRDHLVTPLKFKHRRCVSPPALSFCSYNMIANIPMANPAIAAFMMSKSPPLHSPIAPLAFPDGNPGTWPLVVVKSVGNEGGGDVDVGSSPANDRRDVSDAGGLKVIVAVNCENDDSAAAESVALTVRKDVVVVTLDVTSEA